MTQGPEQGQELSLQEQAETYLQVLAERIAEGDIEGQAALGGIRRVVGELSQHATTDELTGLPDRTALAWADRFDRSKRPPTRRAGVRDEQAGDSRGRREDELPPPEGWACIYVDLDRFKRVNDEMGHPQGDRVLQVVAAILRRETRDHSDEIYRIGGDEFLVFAPLRHMRFADEVKAMFSERFYLRLANILEGEDHDILPDDMSALSDADVQALSIVGATFGVQVFPGARIERTTMLEIAEIDMREQKAARGDADR